MGSVTKIAWTDSTFNCWIGCAKVSAGCARCYAEDLMDRRYGKVKWGRGQARQRTSASYWKQPIQWNKQAGASGKPHRVFCASLADWLDEEVPAGWLADLLELIANTPHLTWQLLTKRPENWSDRLHAAMRAIHNETDELISGWLDGTHPPANVWIGVSAEDQENFDLRVPLLFDIPAFKRFVSAEPLLGPIRMGVGRSALNWLIAGGESGAGARECRIEWIEDLITQCRVLGVAMFVKQLGSNPTQVVTIKAWTKLMPLELPTKKGTNPAEWPIELRVQEFPK